MTLSISIRSSSPLQAEADAIAIAVYEFGASKRAGAPEVLEKLDEALGGGVLALMEAQEFRGKADQKLTIMTLGRLPAARIVIFGLGPKARVGTAGYRTAGARMSRGAQADKVKTLAVSLPRGAEKHLTPLAEGLELGAYRFTKYLTGDKAPKMALETVTLHVDGRVSATAKKEIDNAQKTALGVNIARDLSNEPANIINPMALAGVAQEVGKQFKLKVTVFDHAALKKRKMMLIDAVGRGSANPPCLVHMAHVPAKKAKKRIVVVGKGVTFDSGGLSIKPAGGMQEMKHDMSGAANVVGLMAVVGAHRPNVEVHGIFAAAENMPDGNSYRPGDVWPSAAGKTVEIINTDAEGRLILADALDYAASLEPDLLIDNATLTGACMVALGPTYSGWYANTENAAKQFESALKATGETMWRMPLIEELKDQLKSDVADIRHAGDRLGGSITAALFLREFIGETKNWIHVDIAGPANSDRVREWNPKGATGHAVLTFHELIERAAK